MYRCILCLRLKRFLALGVHSVDTQTLVERDLTVNCYQMTRISYVDAYDFPLLVISFKGNDRLAFSLNILSLYVSRFFSSLLRA